MIAYAALLLSVVQFVAAAPPPPAAWEYGRSSGNGTPAVASVRSSGTVKFPIPAGGPHFATLTIRRSSDTATDVFVSLPVAQFACRAGCQVLVRFDDQKPETVAATTASDAPATQLLLSDPDRFVARLRTARKLRIEVPFAHGAKRVLKFDVAGLRWDAAGGASPK
jgi:hypothetical protein